MNQFLIRNGRQIGKLILLRICQQFRTDNPMGDYLRDYLDICFHRYGRSLRSGEGSRPGRWPRSETDENPRMAGGGAVRGAVSTRPPVAASNTSLWNSASLATERDPGGCVRLWPDPDRRTVIAAQVSKRIIVWWANCGQLGSIDVTVYQKW